MFPSGTEMCLLARLVLPSEGVVSAGELGGVRGQGCGARQRVGSGVWTGMGTPGRIRPFPGSAIFWQSQLLAGTFAPENPQEVLRLKTMSLR